MVLLVKEALTIISNTSINDLLYLDPVIDFETGVVGALPRQASCRV
jgi:hypothetical protein